MKKILFLIHDLGHGGAEKVLVNLVNNMDPTQFDITVMALFGGGVNEQFLSKKVRYLTCFPRAFPGNSHLMKLFSPRQLYRRLIRDRYDIAVSYLEGPSARIISGCPHPETKLVSWIHCTMHTPAEAATGFRSIQEAKACYSRMDALAFVSAQVQEAFLSQCPCQCPTHVCYNTNESDKILSLAQEPAKLSPEEICWCGVGKLEPNKGFDRMIRIQKKLRCAGLNTHLYILGQGPDRDSLEALAARLDVSDSVTFLGYQTNPYKYVARCDLFVCASFAEGFSTAATEALIVGTPVCTAEVSGMKEMLGSHNEYGIVTENDEQALYQGIHQLLADPPRLARYKAQAQRRGRDFSKEKTVRATEAMLLDL